VEGGDGKGREEKRKGGRRGDRIGRGCRLQAPLLWIIDTLVFYAPVGLYKVSKYVRRYDHVFTIATRPFTVATASPSALNFVLLFLCSTAATGQRLHA